MKYEIEIPIMGIEEINRWVRSQHHPQWEEQSHCYECHYCRAMWPCLVVKLAATALHYAQRCQEQEEKEDNDV